MFMVVSVDQKAKTKRWKTLWEALAVGGDKLLLDAWIPYVENSWKHEAPNVKPDWSVYKAS